MFIHRLITTLILIPLALFLIYYAWSPLLGAIVLMLVGFSGWEWSRLIPMQSLIYRAALVSILILLTGICFYFLQIWSVFNIGIWGLIFFAIIQYPRSLSWWGKPVFVGGVSLILLPLFGAGFVALYLMPQGKELIVYLFCLVWAADVGAYIAGKLWGKAKLIPQVSPGKTIQGLVGGIAFVCLVSVAGYFYFSPKYALSWFFFAVLIALVTVLGDLFISMLKRRCQVKDSGHLFPGHGGALDRFDSLIAAMPFYILGMTFMPLGA